MNTQRSIFYWVVILAVLLAGCRGGAAPAEPPTAAAIAPATEAPTAAPPTATFTLTPTATPTPTDTPTPTVTPTPTPACAISDGKWAGQGAEGTSVAFEVRGCTIVNVEISAFPAPDELDWISEEDLSLPIEGNQWSYIRQSGEGQLTLEGIFDTQTSAAGTLKYTKGYFIVDTSLPKDAEIAWRVMRGPSTAPLWFSEGGISLEIPAHWRLIDPQEITIPDQEILIALSAPKGNGFFKVGKEDLVRHSRDAFAASLENVIQSDAKAKLVSRDEILVGGEKAIRFIYTGECPGQPDRTCKYLSTVTQTDQDFYLISYTDDLEPFDQYWPEVEQMLASIQFGQGKPAAPSQPAATKQPSGGSLPGATLSPTASAGPALSPESPYGDPFVVYAAPAGQNLQIFSANLDKDPPESQVLTDENYVAYMPVWSPDGTKIAYLLYNQSAKQNRFKLLDFPGGGAPRALSSQAVNITGSFCWTFDQKYLIWGGNQPNGTEMDIYRLDVASGEIVDLTENSPVWDAFPACSPVSDQIAFVSERAAQGEGMDNIWVMDSQGENLLQLTDSPGWEESRPAWSPDGSEIVFYRFELLPGFSSAGGAEKFGPDGLWAVKADGSGERLVTEDEGVRNTTEVPAWSPDGKYIAYFTGKDEQTTLRVISASGGKPLWSSQLPGDKGNLSWSASSKYLIFGNAQGNPPRIYILAIENPKPALLLDEPFTLGGMFRPGKK